MEQTKFDKIFSEYTKDARDYCQKEGYPTNESGVYLFTSSDGSCSISLDLVLIDFKNYLIEHNSL